MRSELSSILSRSFFFSFCYKSYFYSFYKTLGFYLDLYNKVVALFEYYFCLLYADAVSFLSAVIFDLRDFIVWVCVCVCGIVFIDEVLLFCLPKTSSKWAIIFAIVPSDRVVYFMFLSWDLIFKWALVVILQVPAVRLNTNCKKGNASVSFCFFVVVFSVLLMTVFIVYKGRKIVTHCNNQLCNEVMLKAAC